MVVIKVKGKIGIGCKGDDKASFIEKVRRVHGDRFIFDVTEYKNSKTKIKVRCPKHGVFETLPSNLKTVRGVCPGCGQRVGKDEFIARSRKVHGDKYDYRKVDYVNTTTKVKVICKKHGVFETVPYLHYQNRNGCKKCAVEKGRLNKEKFVEKSRLVHGDKYDYTNVVYETNNSVVEISCPDHGSFKQKARAHLAGHGCSDCSLERQRSNKEAFVEAARLIHGDKYDYTNVVYVGNKSKVKIICPDHGCFYKTPNGHLHSRSGCPKCLESKGEGLIRVFLEKHNIPYEREYRVEPHLYRYDFYVPAANMLIEFNGQQHYHPVELFGGYDAYLETVVRDKEKKRIAKEMGYYLLVISYKQFGEAAVSNVITSALKYNGFDPNTFQS